MFTKISLQDHGFANPHPSYRAKRGCSICIYMIRKWKPEKLRLPYLPIFVMFN